MSTIRRTQCPTLLGARTVGELQKLLKRRSNQKFDLRDCYFLLCALPCSAEHCCRPDHKEGARHEG